MAQEGTSNSPGLLQVTELTPAADECHRDGREAFQWDTRGDCEVRHILDRVADKWSLLVIALLAEKTMRFGELVREIDGVSKKMLTVTLRNLERDGLIHREMFPEIPPRVEYRLTSLGRSLLGTIQSLVGWVEDHQAQVAQARAAFDSTE